MPIKGIEVTKISLPLADIAAAVEDAIAALESNTPVLLRAIEDAMAAIESSAPALSRRKMGLVLDLLGNHDAILEEPAKSAVSTLAESIQERLQFANVRLLNWGMVMLWTNFEAQLEQLLRTLFHEEPQEFLPWGADLSITAEQLQEFESLEEARSTLYEKAIREFSDETIEVRIDELAHRLNVRLERLFSLRLCSDSLREKLTGWGPHSLKSLSDKRNSILHGQMLPIKQLSEIQDAVLILDKFLLNVAGIVADKLAVPLLLQSIPLLDNAGTSLSAAEPIRQGSVPL